MLFCYNTFMCVLKHGPCLRKGLSYIVALFSTWGKKSSEKPNNPTQGHIAKMAEVGYEPASTNSKLTGPLKADLNHQHHFLESSTHNTCVAVAM